MLLVPLLARTLLVRPGDSNGAPVPPSSTAAASPTCPDIDAYRTVYDIIWGSLATIFACVWTAVHQNVPGPSQTRRARVLDMAKIVLVTLLAPEWVLAWAVRQFMRARSLGIELEAARPDARRAWEQHGEVKRVWVDEAAGAGGGDEQDDMIPLTRQTRPLAEAQRQADALYDDGKPEKSTWEAERGAGRLSGKWTIVHGFFAAMGGFHFYQDGKALHPLTPDDVLSLVKSGDLILPTEEEIRGWSRGDVLSKAIAVFQTLWFVVQCIGRRVEDLPMTQLEIMTLAYATMTVAMYGFWWYKPLNIGSPVRVAGVRLPEAQPPMTDDQYLQALRFVAGVQDWFVEMRKHSRVPTFYSGGVSSDQNHEVVGDVVALVAATVFGAIHCAAWNSAFPSGAEVLIWRISSVAIVAAPASVFAALLLDMYLDNMSSAGFMVSTMVVTMVTSVSGGVYIVARLLLLALSFTTLRSLPAGAYQTVQWTVHIPHFT